MKREEAIEVVFGLLPDDAACVCANGMIGREAQRVRDRAGNFYMIGSMGLAASIGLGVAIQAPDRRVVVLDGDGNVLMAMGSLASIAALAPTKLLHVCLDNGEYESTGGQTTISRRLRLEEVARAAGYASAARATDPDALHRAITAALAADGPAFVLAEVDGGRGAQVPPRVALEPPEVTARFSAFLSG